MYRIAQGLTINDQNVNLSVWQTGVYFFVHPFPPPPGGPPVRDFQYACRHISYNQPTNKVISHVFQPGGQPYRLCSYNSYRWWSRPQDIFHGLEYFWNMGSVYARFHSPR